MKTFRSHSLGIDREKKGVVGMGYMKFCSLILKSKKVETD